MRPEVNLPAVRHYYRCCVADCEAKRHVTFAAKPIVEVIGVHNHEPTNPLPPSNTPTKTGTHCVPFRRAIC